MIKKRTRPQLRIREPSPETVEDSKDEQGQEDDDSSFPIADLLELRKLRKSKQGIDSAKLTKGVNKKRTKKTEEVGGLKKGAGEDDDDEESKEAKARRVVRSNNFTQQTNALDVDKHMMAYIEENLKIRSKPRDEEENTVGRSTDPQEELYHISDRWKVDKKVADEGNVTNSMAMLTAIPEVDLGMDTRLKNIEDTEKAKRIVAEERQERKRTNNDEEHLAASRFYRPNLKQKSDADILRDAKLEAMGLLPQDDQHRRPHHERTQMATDELVMERFKKRMRK